MEQVLDDRKILLRIRQGDYSEMGTLIEKYKHPLYAYLYRMVKTDCDDLFQETWVKAWENISRFDISREFRPWLFTIASNLAKDRLRKRQKTETYENGANEISGSDNKVETMDVEDALAKLPPEQRESLVLRYYEGFTNNEISRIMKCPEGTVKTRIFHALLKLKEVL